MKKQRILISLLAVFALVGCAQNNNSKKSSSSGGEGDNVPNYNIDGFKTIKIEAEDINVDNWEYDSCYDEAVIEESKASGGKYLAAADPSSSASASFKITLSAHSNVFLSVAYAQTEDWLESDLEMDKTYSISVQDFNDFKFAEGKNILKARTSPTNWELMPYLVEEWSAREYLITISVGDDVPKGCPSIDYIQIKTTDASSPSVDPGTITEVPDNDFRNLQQYKFLNEEDVTKYKTYATGADLSAPRGMLLRYEELDSASKYYFQVAESEEGLASAPARESTSKVYTFHNAKLGTKYYYRAAVSQDALNAAAIKNITSSSLAPRVVYVPDVLNFRDIGGWESELVPGAKINQGMYFRCAQLNGSGYGTTSKLDSAGKGLAAIKELGIKVDIDMRDNKNIPVPAVSPANTTDWPVSLLDAHVPSGSEPVRWEGEVANNYQESGQTDIAAQYKKIFEAIAEADTKPVMLHCTYGADRTGIATFFLEALLGMSEEDMTRDYVWTQFTQGRTVKLEESEGAEFPVWIRKTKNCEGSTFADKMKNHLMSFGIAESTLEHIREIFVPGYVAKA